MTAYGAVVLAGGAGTRLGGRDKPALLVGGRRLLDRVLDAVADAEPVVVVGPDRAELPTGVVTVCEQPPGGGPVAAIVAGLAVVDVPLVAVLAGDLPFVTAPVVRALRDAVADEPAADGALLRDETGADQLLIGVWRTAALRRAADRLGTDPAGVSVRRLVSGLAIRRVDLPAGAAPPPWWDCDTDDDLRRADQRAGRRAEERP